MRCTIEIVRPRDGRYVVRCVKCGKVRTVKEPARAKMQCGIGPAIIGGPGTELRRLFREIGVKDKAGCNCKELAGQMDAWGVCGCRARLPEIVAELKAKASTYGIGEWAAAGWCAIRQGKPITIEGLAELAISLAAESHQSSCSY